MRLFIGIALPPSLSQLLAQAAHTLIPTEGQQRPRITWTRPENMHITLSFLGQVDPARLDHIQRSLAAIHAPKLHLQLNGSGSFPKAGILHAQIKPSPSLLNLAEQVFQSMETCGFPRERRPYTPHITLARSKEPIRIPPHKADNPAFQQSFTAHELRLYESITRPEGAHYEVKAAFPLL
ncbi:2'-5' RNA ligase [Edaphobacter aggregans]|uniref:RNA 2',3'-cyclic phosphodiesterase n=1 Tax=Edaphobacter aggregans TaxID=570835 RepID=A0A428MIY6_9BACT|nr:RNA 2',3'-cyclic phosphodiesterase [Edaphobacter aggregans]RSL16868.1 2'-5' RNA ligase [Edaphobacter aggregans]